MKNINIPIEDALHARLREFAYASRMTIGAALRFALDHCLPPLPGKDEPATDNQADEGKEGKP